MKSRNKELEFMLVFDLIEDTSKKIHMQQLAIQTCINMIGRTHQPIRVLCKER
ncbi:hypothetical protein ACIGC1_23975 [Peribacillus butanolivorans]|uniref:hypothetical protein n=1 Tax=Peribacillus butanolivorans TaxID=421767 RepID=UPI0037C62F1F